MQAYISCPLTEDMKKITQVAAKLNVMGYKSWWYERGTTYNDSKLKISEMFVLISTCNQFDFDRNQMTAGCKKELELASQLGKQLYLAYWKKSELKIYHIVPAKLAEGRVLGQSKGYLQPYAERIIINNYQIY